MGSSRSAFLIGPLIVLASLARPATAPAHTAWSNGAPVPEWVRNACCGPSDIHHLSPSQVHPVPGGFRIDGLREIVPWAKTLPSEDGDYWIFYRDFTDGTQYVFCFFAPPEGASNEDGPRNGLSRLGGLPASRAGLAA